MATFGLMGLIPGPGEWLEALFMLVSGIGTLAVGFGGGLEVIRRWLFPDAQIDGRRSFVAGIMAPAAVFIAGVFLGPFSSGLALLGMLFSVAMVSAVLMFFAWLTPAPEDMRDPEYEHGPDLLKNPMA